MKPHIIDIIPGPLDVFAGTAPFALRVFVILEGDYQVAFGSYYLFGGLNPAWIGLN